MTSSDVSTQLNHYNTLSEKILGEYFIVCLVLTSESNKFRSHLTQQKNFACPTQLFPQLGGNRNELSNILESNLLTDATKFSESVKIWSP